MNALGEAVVRSVIVKGVFSFVDETSIDFSKGLTCLIGANGSGKTNLLRVIDTAMRLGQLDEGCLPDAFIEARVELDDQACDVLACVLVATLRVTKQWHGYSGESRVREQWRHLRVRVTTTDGASLRSSDGSLPILESIHASLGLDATIGTACKEEDNKAICEIMKHNEAVVDYLHSSNPLYPAYMLCTNLIHSCTMFVRPPSSFSTQSANTTINALEEMALDPKRYVTLTTINNELETLLGCRFIVELDFTRVVRRMMNDDAAWNAFEKAVERQTKRRPREFAALLTKVLEVNVIRRNGGRYKSSGPDKHSVITGALHANPVWLAFFRDQYHLNHSCIRIAAATEQDKTATAHKNTIALFFGIDGREIAAEFAPMGMQQTLSLLVSVIVLRERHQHGTLLIDEPLTSLHPSKMHEVRSRLEALSPSMQILVATHAPALLPASLDQCIHVRAAKGSHGSSLSKLSAFDEQTKSLLKSHTLRPLLFAARVLLVEGHSDAQFVHALIDVAGGAIPAWSVVELSGKGNAPTISRVAHTIGITWGVVLDKDALSGQSREQSAAYKVMTATGQMVTGDAVRDAVGVSACDVEALGRAGVFVWLSGSLEDAIGCTAAAVTVLRLSSRGKHQQTNEQFLASKLNGLHAVWRRISYDVILKAARECVNDASNVDMQRFVAFLRR